MKANYEKLWKLLADKSIKKKDFRKFEQSLRITNWIDLAIRLLLLAQKYILINADD